MNNISFNDKSVMSWLLILVIMVIIMVSIGGITRLTESGLSMVTWKPVTGIVPPFSEEAWQKEFEVYKSSPEYIKKNYHFELSDFKKIYFWEFLHRAFGRLIGLVFFIPYMFFLISKKIPKTMRFKIFIAFILGGSQGVLGWYMVKSGLVDIPAVSHYRLCAHLLLAYIIIFYLKVLYLNIKIKREWSFFKQGKGWNFVILLIFLQIIYGAFVAGKDAGLTYNTFPKMGKDWFPMAAMMFSPWWINFFENTAMIQFIHRLLGTILLLVSCGHVIRRFAIKKKTSFLDKNLYALSFLILVQFGLGILTLINLVPISLAALHQFCASLIVVLCANIFYLVNTKEIKY